MFSCIQVSARASHMDACCRNAEEGMWLEEAGAGPNANSAGLEDSALGDDDPTDQQEDDGDVNGNQGTRQHHLEATEKHAVHSVQGTRDGCEKEGVREWLESLGLGSMAAAFERVRVSFFLLKKYVISHSVLHALSCV